MKHWLVLILGLLTTFVLLFQNCAPDREKVSGSGGSGTEEPESPPIDENSPPNMNSNGGAFAPLVPRNTSVFLDYVGEPRNNPVDIKVQVDLFASGDSPAGEIGISYIDKTSQGDIFYEAFFTTGSSQRAIQYNEWVDVDGESHFHAVFEDSFDNGGGIVLVIDEIIDWGDGGGPEDAMGGSIWYKNFGLTPAPHPPTYCWFVSLGPFDCRPWPSGTGMAKDRSIDPKGGYKLLGRFQDLDKRKAFNESEDIESGSDDTESGSDDEESGG